MGFFSKDTDEQFQQVLDLVKDYSEEEFKRWVDAVKKAYKSYQDFKKVEDEKPADEIDEAEQALADYIEVENEQAS